VSYEGTSATGAHGTCSGTVSGATIHSTCSAGGTTCDVIATKK
jgi:hypothetical protein